MSKHNLAIFVLEAMTAFLVSLTLALAEDIYWLPNAILLIAVLLVMTLEMFSHWRAVGPFFKTTKELWDKALLFGIIIFGVLCDAVAQAMVPSGFKFQEIIDRNIFTKSTLIWIFVVQGLKFFGHVKSVLGKDVIPPALRWFVVGLREVNKEKWKEEKKTDEPPPQRRLTDRLDEVQLAMIREAAERVLQEEKQAKEDIGL